MSKVIHLNIEPDQKKTQALSLRLTNKTSYQLREICKATGANKSKVITNLIKAGYESVMSRQ